MSPPGTWPPWPPKMPAAPGKYQGLERTADVMVTRADRLGPGPIRQEQLIAATSKPAWRADHGRSSTTPAGSTVKTRSGTSSAAACTGARARRRSLAETTSSPRPDQPVYPRRSRHRGQSHAGSWACAPWCSPSPWPSLLGGPASEFVPAARASPIEGCASWPPVCLSSSLRYPVPVEAVSRHFNF
jgi:hypothetical protein